jgi:succinate dehydrogenase/fumarate reductase cytochrome b subunit
MAPSLKRMHRLTGITIAAFLLLHVTNHLFALAGPATHIAVMKFFRHLYRFPPVEILLLGCVVFQVISGIILVFKKGFLRKPVYVKVQVLSGLYLSFFLIVHVSAVMMGRYQFKVDTDFYFAAGVANAYPDKLFFIPYYTLSLVAAFAHIAVAHYIKRLEGIALSSSVEDTTMLHRKYKKETAIIAIGGGMVTVLIMLALCGVFYTI